MDIWQRCAEYADHIGGIGRITCRPLRIDGAWTDAAGADSPCHHCGYARCFVTDTHLYGCSEAYRWGGKYVYYCPLGLVFAASSLSGESGDLIGGLVAGPMVMGDAGDTLAELFDYSMAAFAAGLPVMTTAQVRHLAEIMAAVTAFISGYPHGRAGALEYEQEKMLNTLYEIKDKLPEDAAASQILIEGEKQLRDKILNKDKSGTQELLNELLGTIYFSHDYNLPRIKARIIELIVILSRATIDAGADINEILLSNTGYIREIEKFTSLEELSVWVTGIMHRFIRYAFDFTQVKHSNVVYKVMEYVKAHYNEKISLDDMARHVYLSRTYLSSIFAEETGQSLFSYINYVRVEKSKLFLRDPSILVVDVAGLCGFDDQSYFTKVFRRYTGMSPKKYRDSHRQR